MRGKVYKMRYSFNCEDIRKLVDPLHYKGNFKITELLKRFLISLGSLILSVVLCVSLYIMHYRN